MDQPKLMTEAEARNTLGISEAGLYRLRKDRLISFYRVRGRVMFSEAHLADYLARVERKADGEPALLTHADTPAAQAA